MVYRRTTFAQRDSHNLHGRVPSGPPLTLLQDVKRTLESLKNVPGTGKERELVRYEALMWVLNSDEELFFATAQHDLRTILPMIYTPAVGTACLNYSRLSIPSRGLWLGIDRAGSLESILASYKSEYPDVQVICVTDGERILGLGDLSANGHGIPVGKLLLYSACGGISPSGCLPITLDFGCDTDSIRNDDYYIGLRQNRVRGDEYDAFIDEFMNAARNTFGKNCLIQFEDFANRNALRLLNKYKDEYCTFNDDIQGTAAVGLAGMLSALRMEGVPSNLNEHTFLFYGAGSAGIGIANLIVQELVRQGEDEMDSRKRCYFMDSKGLIYKGRDNLTEEKKTFAHEVNDEVIAAAKNGIAGLVRLLKPTGLIGVSTIYNAFDTEVLEAMAALQKRPLIFALSNPTSKAECTAEAAYKATNGDAVFASGSPFDPVTIGERTLVPGQGNNAYVFPGLGLGIVACKARHVTDKMILAASRRLAELVKDEHLAVSCVYPPLEELLDISSEIARAVAVQAVEDDVAHANDLPTLQKIKELMYAPVRALTE